MEQISCTATTSFALLLPERYNELLDKLKAIIRSPLEWAWMKILARAYDDETRVEMEQLFSD